MDYVNFAEKDLLNYEINNMRIYYSKQLKEFRIHCNDCFDRNLKGYFIGRYLKYLKPTWYIWQIRYKLYRLNK